MKLGPLKVLSGEKPLIQVQSMREEEIPSRGEIFHDLHEDEGTTGAYLDTKVKHAVANASENFSDTQPQATKDATQAAIEIDPFFRR